MKLTSMQLGLLATLESNGDPRGNLTGGARTGVSITLTRLERLGMVVRSDICPGVEALTPAAIAALDEQLPRCGNCNHRELHCLASGCNHFDGDEWCECTEFVAEKQILDAGDGYGDGSGLEKSRALVDEAPRASSPHGAPGTTLSGGTL